MRKNARRPRRLMVDRLPGWLLVQSEVLPRARIVPTDAAAAEPIAIRASGIWWSVLTR